MRIYNTAIALALSLASLSCSTLSQRAMNLYPKAREDCETQLGRMERVEKQGSIGLAFRTPRKVTGFEINSSGIFALESKEFYTSEERKTWKADGEINRYLTDYPHDNVWEKFEFQLNPEHAGVDSHRIMGDGSEQRWTREYRSEMKKLLGAIEQCAAKRQ